MRLMAQKSLYCHRFAKYKKQPLSSIKKNKSLKINF